MPYKYGDFVYGINARTGSIFSIQDSCIGMVVKTKDGCATGVLLLDSRYLDNAHKELTKEEFIEEVRRARSDEKSFPQSLLRKRYSMYIMSRRDSNQDDFFPLTPTAEGFEIMNHHTQLLIQKDGCISRTHFIDYQTFQRRYLSPNFLKPEAIPSNSL